ncbi:MAG: spheroidene monooxygenase [Pseudomonadota bacterium]
MASSQTVTLSLFRFGPALARAWAFGQMGLVRGALGRTPDIQFWKLCGSGTGEGFTPVPNTAVYAILAAWPDEPTARARVAEAPVWQKYRARSVEDCTIFLQAASARGVWAGAEPFEAHGDLPDGPLAALTRATVKPKIALQFWKQVPNISKVIGQDPNVAFKIGIGEVPWLHQVTFSIWPDTKTMGQFARKDGPHARAIAAVREGNWFREELYARFRVLGATGLWEGRTPLHRLDAPSSRPERSAA